MSGFTVAIFDEDSGYISKFLSIMTHRHASFRIIGFTDISVLAEYVEDNSLGILLYSPKNKYKKENTEENKYLEKVLASPNIRRVIYFDEYADAAISPHFICRYQPITDIIAELNNSYREILAEDPDAATHSYDISCLYCPGGTFGKSRLALALTENLSSDGSVLYLESGRFSGLRTYLSAEKRQSLSRILYYFKSSPSKLGDALRDCVIRHHNTDILLAPDSAEDLDIISQDEWTKLIDSIATVGGYSHILIDMSDSLRNVDAIYRQCTNIYVCTSHNSTGNPDLFQSSDKTAEERTPDMYILSEFTEYIERIRPGASSTIMLLTENI